MSGVSSASPALTGAIGLLERSACYLFGSLQLVTPEMLGRETPCGGWDLRTLLCHLDDSLLALGEASGGAVEPAWSVAASRSAEATVVRDHARQLIGRWSGAAADQPVTLGDLSLSAPMVVAAGAIEISVHGWDAAQAAGRHRAIPPALAEELLEVAGVLVADADRPTRFAPAVRLPALACASDRLLAFVGRNPHRTLANRAASWLCRIP